VVPQDGWCLQNEKYADLANQRRKRVVQCIAEHFHEGLYKSSERFCIESVLALAAVKTDQRVSDMAGRFQTEDDSRCRIQYRLQST